jgi:hypothetical protein
LILLLVQLAAALGMAAVEAEPAPKPDAAAVAQPEAHAEAPLDSAADRGTFEAVYLHVEGVDEAAAATALGLRLGDVAVQTTWDLDSTNPSDGGRHAFINLRARARVDRDETVRMEVITSEGRAYVRDIGVPPDDMRAIASTAANLLFSIERDAVQADREGAHVPLTHEAEEVAKALEPSSKTEAAECKTPEPSCPTCPECSEPVAVEPPVRVPPGWELGPTLAAGTLLSLAPPFHGRRVAGTGAALGFDARHRGGAQLALAIRLLGVRDDEVVLRRLRIAAGAGYGLRRGKFDFPFVAMISIEPWFAHHAGNQAKFPGSFLLGGYLRLVPGLRIEPARSSVSSVRLGARIDLGGSFALDDGAKVVGVNDFEDRALFRLGGLELMAGIELGISFGTPAKPQ